MAIDIELYRREVEVRTQPRVCFSVIDIAPSYPRKTMVFLHGFGGQAKQWIYQLQHFSLHNRVIALDMRGHGRADAPGGNFTMDQLLTDVASALGKLDIADPIVLVGHSFGGAVACEFAAQNPDAVERLILVATAGEFRLNFLYRLGLNLPLPILRLLDPFTRGWLSAAPSALKPWYHNLLVNWKGWSLFRNISLPTLVIRGHRDLVFARPMYDEVARSIPGSEKVDVGASGHMVMLERRQAVNRAMERFLDGEQRSWREERGEFPAASRVDLAQQRPWLVHYDERVPFTIAIPNTPLFHLLQSAARRFPRKIAIHFEGLRLSYRRLNLQVNCFANALRSLGLEKGDRVLLLLPNTPQLVIAYFATLKAGGVVVFTLPANEPEELIRQALDSGARIVVAASIFSDLVAEIHEQADIQHVILTNIGDYLPLLKRLALRWKGIERPLRIRTEDRREGRHAFVPLLKPYLRIPAPDVDVRAEDPAVIQYTGGTTAKPKGVLLSHRNLVANTIQTRHWIPDAKEGQERFLCVLPFSHSYGMTTGLNVPVALSSTMIIKAKFDVQETLKTIKRMRPSIFPGVPQMYMSISSFPGVRKFEIDSIRACISGAAPLPIEVQETFEKLTRGRLVEGYGLTEASPVTHANPLHGRRKLGSIGIPLPSTEAKIVDLRNSHQEVPHGQIGELTLRGPQVMLGYWGKPEETAKALTKDGWLLTGDVAQMDEDGYCRIIARRADMWYPGKPTEPAFPRDVEEVLYEVPQVKEVAVVAIARRPIAFVIAGSDRPSGESLIAYCQRRLPPDLVPRLMVFVDEFPRTLIGKVIRHELAKHYAEHIENNL